MPFAPAVKPFLPISSTGSPLVWEHVNLTGDYLWEEKPRLDVNGFRPIPFTL